MRENEIRSLPENLFGTELIFIVEKVSLVCSRSNLWTTRPKNNEVENQLKKAETPNLIGIDVQMNQISSFENSTFLDLKTMTHLLMNDNLIEKIPDYSFQDLGSLQELHLQNVSFHFFSDIENKTKFYRIAWEILPDWIWLVCKRLRKFISKEIIYRV